MILSAAETFEFFMEDLLDVLVSNAIHLFELVGVIVLIAAGIRGVVNYVRHDPMVRLNLGTWHCGGYALHQSEAHVLVVLPERIYKNDCVVVDYDEKDWMEIVL